MEAEGRAAATLKKTKWLIDFALPLLGERPIISITAQEVLWTLKKVEGRGTYETARRLKGLIGGVFRYAIVTARASTDPTVALHGALISPKVKHRAALTKEIEIGQLLRTIDKYKGRGCVGAALRLAPHIFVRPGELRTMEWSEVDIDNAIWIIPAIKTKTRTVQVRVPKGVEVRVLFRHQGSIPSHPA